MSVGVNPASSMISSVCCPQAGTGPGDERFAGKARCRVCLQHAVALTVDIARNIVRMPRSFLGREHWRKARIGALEQRAPLVARARGEDGGKAPFRFWPALRVVAVGELRIAENAKLLQQ